MPLPIFIIKSAINFIFLSDDPADSINYYFIEDFCGDSDEIDVYESLFIRSNGVAQVARFGLESFAFAHDTLSSIYLHCNVSKLKALIKYKII